MPTDAAPVGASVMNEQLIITAVENNSPAEEVKLQAGDIILSLESGEEGEIVDTPSSEIVQNFIVGHDEEEFMLTYKRGEEIKTVALTPRRGIIGDTPANRYCDEFRLVS